MIRQSIAAPLGALTLAAICAFPHQAQSTEASQPDGAKTSRKAALEEVTIIGTREQAQDVTGSAHVVGPVELERFAYADIQRIARQVPGVSIQVEDGYGLRPNISIRGVATERSGRITLLEDNVLVAPAPYSAPSAYYFPTAGRMAAFEVLKGPSAITQGPYTIGGALNMVSTPIPVENETRLLMELGEDATYRVHATHGGQDGGFGYLVETHQWQSDGFQSIDRSPSDTGLEVADYMVKLRFESTDPAAPRQRLDLKLQYANQDSEQSYLGLTDADFQSDPFRRYGLSALDNIATEHNQAIARYQFEFENDWVASATAYWNDHKRDWFKTEGLDPDGSTSAADFDRISWFNVIQAVNLGQPIGGLDSDALQAILDGADTAPGSIQLRSNNRSYRSFGLQLGMEWSGNLAGASHELEFGLRFHEDSEDRLQRNSSYSQINGQLVLDDFGQLGNAGNRIQRAEAIAFHVHDRIEFGNWVLSPGLRYEDIDQSRVRYEIRPDRTIDPASRAPDNFRDSRENQTQVWLPGLGAMYRVSDALSIIGGAHKGFTAPSNSPGAREEQAMNYELGVRYDNGRTRAEVVGFLSDYENILGVCTASSGAGCEIGDAFNGDAATVKGVEVILATELMSRDRYRVPLEITYTWTDGQFDTDIADTDFFGSVSAGDPLPYIPDQQLHATAGLENSHWSTWLSATYVDEVCVRASCGEFEQVDSALIWDLSGEYRFNEAWSLFARIENLTSENDIMGRHPYGARPNRDRTAALGFKVAF